RGIANCQTDGLIGVIAAHRDYVAILPEVDRVAAKLSPVWLHPRDLAFDADPTPVLGARNRLKLQVDQANFVGVARQIKRLGYVAVRQIQVCSEVEISAAGISR